MIDYSARTSHAHSRWVIHAIHIRSNDIGAQAMGLRGNLGFRPRRFAGGLAARSVAILRESWIRADAATGRTDTDPELVQLLTHARRGACGRRQHRAATQGATVRC